MSSTESTTIEVYGSTTLVQSGANYYLLATDGSSVELSYGGSPVVAGQFGAWLPIGAEKTTSGYEVALALPGADQYAIWYLDESGNFLSGPIGTVSGESSQLQSFELSFEQDLNRDGRIGFPSPTAIESFGSTALFQSGSTYFLGAAGAEVELSYGGAPVVAGQFGAWVPIGAEKTASGYEVALALPGSDQYSIWYLDGSGNFVSAAIGTVSGESGQLQSFEVSFQQDLNGDGRIGLPPPITIEAVGSTTLVQRENNYYLDSTDGSSVALNYGGAPVVTGQFGAWVPLGAEKTASGYEVALQLTGADQYTVWYLDAGGNYLSSPIAAASGASGQLQLFEVSFQQDLNGDGRIGPPPAIVIESAGSTTLVQSGSIYFLNSADGSSVALSYGGAFVVAGQFGAWVPIGAEKSGTGYEVALALSNADQFAIWSLDASGNFVSAPIGTMAGENSQLESWETSFQQDLNGDGRIGLPPPNTIEAVGSTTLVQSGSNYFLDAADGSAVELSYGAAPVVVGEFGSWTPIGAEKTASGYEVALRLTGADQYTVWNLDNNGNYTSSPIATASGASSDLQSLETSFQQDLNGDGSIGLPSPTVIESFGSTTLVQNGSNYFLDAADGSAVEMRYGGAVVIAGQFGAWTPIGAEKTGSGYEVAWKEPGLVPGAEQYSVWNVDGSGNYVSGALVPTSGARSEFQSFEPSFQQDLNGDGFIGIPHISDPSDTPTFIYQGVDANGVQLYEISWNVLGAHPFAVRVLAPDHPSASYAHSFLFALPSGGGLDQDGFGSGLDRMEQLDTQNQYNATIIEPVFPLSPWYADNPDNSTIDYDTFTGTLLPAWVDSTLATTGTEKNLLVGYSKSGYGALDLLLKHPAVFGAAAAWDFPADMPNSGALGSSSMDNYGTNANFQDNYQLTGSLLDQLKATFTSADRIWISGYSLFQSDIADLDALLTSHGISHTLAPQTSALHSWLGDWLPEALNGVYGLEQDLISSAPTALALTSPATAGLGSGNAGFGADSQSSMLISPVDQLSDHG